MNQHDETRIIVVSLVLGAAFLTLGLRSYREPLSSFALGGGLLALVIVVSAATGASPWQEGAVIKVFFVSGFVWAVSSQRGGHEAREFPSIGRHCEVGSRLKSGNA